MTKKIIAAVMTMVMVFGAAGISGAKGEGASAVITASAAETVKSGTSWEGQDWILDSEGTLTITSVGSGKYGRIPEVRDMAKKVVFCEGITEILPDAFQGDAALESIEFPNSLESIDGEAFKHCKRLTKVVIPENVTVIYGWSFDRCDNLRDITILGKNVKLGETLFGWTDHPTEANKSMRVEGFVVTCYEGSTTEEYCRARGFAFRLLRSDSKRKGDVNADGKIDIEDAVMVINHINGVSALTSDDMYRADIDSNGNTDIEDAVGIISHVNGISVIG